MGLGAVQSGRLAGTQLAVYLEQTLFHAVGGVLLQRGFNPVIGAEIVADFLVGTQTQSTQENGNRDLAVFIDTHIENVVGVVFIFQPGTAVGDHGGAEQFLTGLVVHAGRTDQLRNNDALRAVNHKGAAVGHQGELAHEYFGFLDLTALLVQKAGGNAQSGSIGCIALLALDHAVIGLFVQLVVDKIQDQISREVRNAGNIVENLFEALFQKPLIGILLDLNQVRHREDFFDAGKAHTGVSAQLHRFDIHHWLNHSIPNLPFCRAGKPRNSFGRTFPAPSPLFDRDNFLRKLLRFFERCAKLYHSVLEEW